MFWSTPSTVRLLLEEEIARVLRELKHHDQSSDGYQRRLDRVVVLYRMLEEEKSDSASKDTLAVILGNLMGIFMIIKHEHVNVVTSRAMQFLLSPRWPKIR